MRRRAGRHRYAMDTMPQLSDHIVLPATLPANGGRPPKMLEIGVVRALGVDDILFLTTAESGGTYRPLQRIRASHHNIAILLSQGKDPVEVSRIMGRSPSNIRKLMDDPAFKNLMAFYNSQGEQAREDMLLQLKDLGQSAMAQLQEDLENHPEKFDKKDLMRIVEVTMDRVGMGPTKTVKTLNTADAIRELVKKKEEERKGKVIDVDAA